MASDYIRELVGEGANVAELEGILDPLLLVNVGKDSIT